MPSDVYGVFIHELTHVIQLYGDYEPGWLTEGIADYTRYKCFLAPDWSAKFEKNTAERNPMGAYSATTGSLLYLKEAYSKEIARPLSMAMRTDTYSSEIWQELTGKSLAALCVDYINLNSAVGLGSVLETTNGH